MNRAKVEVTGPEGTQTVFEEAIDPLVAGIWTPGPHPHASVGFTAGKSVGYGELKLTAHVTLSCDQTSTALELAATKAFQEAVRYLTAGFQMLTAEAPK